MQFIFFDAADNRLFVRDDAETATWSVKGMTFSADFPFVADKKIERGMRVGFVDETGILQPFEIRKVKTYEPDHYQEVTAEHIAISELTDEFYLGADVTDETAAEALETLLDGTIWEVGNSTADNVSSVDIDKGNVWQNVRSIEQNWNVWITPRVTFDATGITGRYLDIAPAVGVWRGVTIDINGNGDEMDVTIDDSDVLTAVYGLGGVDPSSESDAPLTFASAVWEATEDHPAKPADQTYVEDPTAKSLYGRNGRNRFGYYQNGNIHDADLLLEKSWEYLKTTNKPKVTVECIVRDLKRMGYADQGIRIHDKVQVRIQPIGQILVLDVDDLEVDLLDPTATRPTIGTYIPNIVYINRETNLAATGGSYRNGGDDNSSNEIKVFNTQIAYTDNEIALEAYQRAYQDGLLSNSLLDAWASLNVSATNITGLVAGAGCQLGADGRLVVDGNGFPVFTDSNPSNLYSRVTQAADEVNSLVTGVSAGEFNDHTAYAKDTYVTHKENGVTKLYQFTSAHASGPWTGTDVVEVTGLFTKVSQNSEAITLKVSKGDVATQLSVECGNVTITGGDLVVNGMITASDLAAGTISAIDVGSGTIGAGDITTGDLSVADTLTMAGGTLDASQADVSCGSLTVNGADIEDGIADAQIVLDSGTTYKLQIKRYGDTTWTDAGSFNRASAIRSVRTLTQSGGTVNVGSKVYTVNANIVYDDNSTGSSTIAIPLTIGSYDSTLNSYPVTVAGISGISISATGAYNAGYTAGETAMLSLYDVISADKLTSGTITASGSNVTIPLSIVIGDDLADPPVTKTNNSKSVTANIAGVLYPDTATITTTAHQMTPPNGYAGFSSVVIPAINLQDDTFYSNGQYLVPANKDGYGTINVSVSASVSSTSYMSARAGQSAVDTFIAGATAVTSAAVSKDGAYSTYYKFSVSIPGGATNYYYFHT